MSVASWRDAITWRSLTTWEGIGSDAGGGGDFDKRKRRILIGDKEYLATPAEADAIVSRMQDTAPIAVPAPSVKAKARGAAKVLVESLIAAELLRLRAARELEEDDEEVMMLLCA